VDQRRRLAAPDHLTQSKQRSTVLLKGQSHSQAFATAGVYDYICGLHPSMKGTIEVK